MNYIEATMDFKLWVENTDWDFSHEEGFGGKVQQKEIDGVSIVYQMQSNGNVQLSSIRVKHKDRKMGKARSAIIEFLRETDNAGKSVELVGRGNPLGEPKMLRHAGK